MVHQLSEPDGVTCRRPAESDIDRADDGLGTTVVAKVRQMFCGMHGHDNLLQFEHDRMFLRCVSCGHEIAGLGADRDAADRDRGRRCQPTRDRASAACRHSSDRVVDFYSEIDFIFRREHKRAGFVAPLGVIASVLDDPGADLPGRSTDSKLNHTASASKSDASDAGCYPPRVRRIVAITGARPASAARRPSAWPATARPLVICARRPERLEAAADEIARRRRRGAADRRRRHAASRHERARRAGRGTVRTARRDDVQRRLRHLRRDRSDRRRRRCSG